METLPLNILVLNSGSSSLKILLYRVNNGRNIHLLQEMQMEWKNSSAASSYKEKLRKAISSFSEQEPIHAAGHRIVHGGALYHSSILIDAEVKKTIYELSKLAPLHNLADLQGIELIEELLPDIPQIAVFDTAFHRTLPQAAYVYPGPHEWISQGIRRYGFHGVSYQYCTERAAELLPSAKKVVICHLGSGASLSAIRNKESIDTTMGFTPLEGLMMDTRSGTLDPGILLHLLQTKTPDALTDTLYRHSGLLGLSKTSSDMRDILQKVSEGDPDCKLALEVYLHRLNACLGSMIASLSGLDALVFTAGIGENTPLIRKRVCENFAFLGISLDLEKNEKPGSDDCILSHPESNIKVLLIHTKEALEIARECYLLLNNTFLSKDGTH